MPKLSSLPPSSACGRGRCAQRAGDGTGAGTRESLIGEARRDQLAQGIDAVADAVLLLRLHLAEGNVAAVGDKDGVVTEASLAARRKDEAAVHNSFKGLAVGVRPGERERA